MPRSDSPVPASATRSSEPLAVALRQATAAAHEQIEQLPLMRRITASDVSLDDYRRYLYALSGVYAALEPPLLAGLDAPARARLGVQPKLPALLHDLSEQGLMPSPLPIAPFTPQGASASVGGLYVLEGATLGGRMMLKSLRRTLGAALDATTFLDFHGERTGIAWKHFSTALDALYVEGAVQADEAIAGANDAFAAIYRGLALATAADGRDRSHARSH